MLKYYMFYTFQPTSPMTFIHVDWIILFLRVATTCNNMPNQRTWLTVRYRSSRQIRMVNLSSSDDIPVAKLPFNLNLKWKIPKKRNSYIRGHYIYIYYEPKQGIIVGTSLKITIHLICTILVMKQIILPWPHNQLSRTHTHSNTSV